MFKSIIIGVVTTFLGGIVGYFVSNYQEKAVPAVVIESINFAQIEREKMPLIEIEAEIRDYSKRSRWVKSLDEKIELTEMESRLSDIEGTIIGLDKLSVLIPKLIKYAKSHDSTAPQVNRYKDFLRDNSDAETLTYFTMYLAGFINNRELSNDNNRDLSPESLEEKHKVVVKNYNEALNDSQDDKSDGKQRRRTDREISKSKSAAIALALILDGQPTDLLPFAQHIQDDIPEQLSLLRKISESFQEKKKKSSDLKFQDYVNVSCVVVNSGKKTISFDKYATLTLPGTNKTFFLKSDEVKEKLIVPSGEAKTVVLRSESPLEQGEAKELKTLYTTKILNCKLTMRTIGDHVYTPEWIHSTIADFSGNTGQIKETFLKAATGH